ncbi:Hypothetical predicted protein [Podarcis lilfordi]|uniref:Uncharacterized protein n=1 Tax=Podarcis lilfordi TaxID=74358 RepID=A0AA35LFA1_9SAUR|nr:Hypothetical predicted protein [Podarcis lilfordi]
MLVASRTLSNHLILCHPLLLVPSIFPNIRVFSKESSLLMRWPKYRSLSFRICPSSEHSGLISFRMDRFDLLAVHGALKSLLQHHNSKAIIRRSAFFMVQLLKFPNFHWRNVGEYANAVHFRPIRITKHFLYPRFPEILIHIEVH